MADHCRLYNYMISVGLIGCLTPALTGLHLLARSNECDREQDWVRLTLITS